MPKNEAVMSLMLARKFPAEARAMADEGMPLYEARSNLEALDKQDKNRVNAIMALSDAPEYQPLLRGMAGVSRLDVDMASELLSAMMKQDATIYADAGYAGEGYDADTIDHILKNI